MPYDRNLHHRRTVRMQGYDYAERGAYFVSICTRGRECLFGEIVDGEMRLNDVGRMVEAEWLRTPAIRPNVMLDEYMIMPNHLHGIVVITEKGPQKDPPPALNLPSSTGRFVGLQSPAQTIGSIVRGFKAASTKKIWNLPSAPQAPIQQGKFYEHVIRDERDMDRIRAYIIANPGNWPQDDNNPLRLNAGDHLE